MLHLHIHAATLIHIYTGLLVQNGGLAPGDCATDGYSTIKADVIQACCLFFSFHLLSDRIEWYVTPGGNMLQVIVWVRTHHAHLFTVTVKSAGFISISNSKEQKLSQSASSITDQMKATQEWIERREAQS